MCHSHRTKFCNHQRLVRAILLKSLYPNTWLCKLLNCFLAATWNCRSDSFYSVHKCSFDFEAASWQYFYFTPPPPPTPPPHPRPPPSIHSPTPPLSVSSLDPSGFTWRKSVDKQFFLTNMKNRQKLRDPTPFIGINLTIWIYKQNKH